MPKVKSREYKFMLDQRMFGRRKESVREFWGDASAVAARVGIESKGRLDRGDKRLVHFLDTPDQTLRNNRLLLRYRKEMGEAQGEYTLKARVEDRYLAGGMDLRPGKGNEGKRKFEEDIAAPFRSRFSQSVTIKSNGAERPTTVAEAARLFPILGALRRDGTVCDGATPLSVVGGMVARERVLKGGVFALPAACEASAALILWSAAWKGRIMAAEFSFRYENDDEEYPLEVVEAGFELFAALQALDWHLPGVASKTQFAYGER